MSLSIRNLARTYITLLGCIVLSACVSNNNVQISSDTSDQFAGKTIAGTDRVKPDFSATTAGKATFGVIGAAAMISAGNRIIAENNVDDPANYIRDTLLADLTQKYTLTASDKDFGELKTANTSAIAQQYNETDFVLDVQTINWSFAYFPTDWNNYRVIYSAKLRLVDTQSKRLIAEGFCARVPEKTENAPSMDELLADKAFVIKSELRKSANQCIAEFRNEVLQLPASPLADLKPQPKMDQHATEAADDSAATTSTASHLDNESAETEFPELLNQLTSASSVEMRSAAISIGQQKIYRDEAIFLASLEILRSINSQSISKKEKVRVDGLAWIALNVGHSKDERARAVLAAVGANDGLPKKVRNHALHGIKILDGLVEK